MYCFLCRLIKGFLVVVMREIFWQFGFTQHVLTTKQFRLYTRAVVRTFLLVTRKEKEELVSNTRFLFVETLPSSWKFCFLLRRMSSYFVRFLAADEIGMERRTRIRKLGIFRRHYDDVTEQIHCIY